MKRKRQSPKPHWYKHFVGECPVCGKDQSYRQRVYGRRPKTLAKRYVQLPQSACCDHFL